MNTDNYDIYFPHLGIGVEHLGNSISVFGFRIAYYGIIIGIGMLMGVLIANGKQQAITDTKLDELTREVREHNSFAQRVPVIEEQIKVINHRIQDLEHIRER